MKLSEWAKLQGITYKTAWNWFKAGDLPVKAVQTATGTILVEPVLPASKSKSAWIYARVSSPEKKGDLERQAERCVAFCQANGWTVETVVKEIASGMNDKRPKLKNFLRQNHPVSSLNTKIV
jgi:predicted site-specific integrase-resolvase